MASLPKTLAAAPLKVAAKVGRGLRDPLKPVRSFREVWNADDETEDEFQEMTLGEHLEELRQRLVKMCYAFVPGFLIGFLLASRALGYIARQAQVEQYQTLAPTDAFVTFMKMAVYIGLGIAFPIIFYQMFSFVAPGMTKKEKRYLLRSLPFVTLLFFSGVSFAFFVAAPRAFDFLSGFQSDLFKWELVADEVISFYLQLMIGLGLAFELPALMFLLARIGVANSAKQRGFWRIALVLIMIASAIITPTPDPFNMAIVAIPILLLYIFGLFLAKRADKLRENHTAKLAAG
jgi:sec-independent protein translocase protein TatC